MQGTPIFKKTKLCGHDIIEYQPHARTLIVKARDGMKKVVGTGKCDDKLYAVQHVVLPYVFFTFGSAENDSRHITILAMLFSNKPAEELKNTDHVFKPPVSNIDYGQCGMCLGIEVDYLSLEQAANHLWQSVWSHGAYAEQRFDEYWQATHRGQWRESTVENVTKVDWTKTEYSRKLELKNLDRHLNF